MISFLYLFQTRGHWTERDNKTLTLLSLEMKTTFMFPSLVPTFLWTYRYIICLNFGILYLPLLKSSDKNIYLKSKLKNIFSIILMKILNAPGYFARCAILTSSKKIFYCNIWTGCPSSSNFCNFSFNSESFVWPSTCHACLLCHCKKLLTCHPPPVMPPPTPS